MLKFIAILDMTIIFFFKFNLKWTCDKIVYVFLGSSYKISP